MADDCPKCPPVGAPPWLATFADLMSLLMCFFILLLSFATMDANKFKKMAESLEMAFGVQREVPAYEVPLGTSIIAQNFSPGKVDPTILDEVRQQIASSSESLEITIIEKEQIREEIIESLKNMREAEAEEISEALKEDINKGLLSVEVEGLKVIIRINEKGAFDAGSSILKTKFEPVMLRITKAALGATGNIRVTGHTDNIPISTDWFRSNWELSAVRAVSVGEFMLRDPNSEPTRFVMQGYADTQPLVENNSEEHRSMNRRVDIVIAQDELDFRLEHEMPTGLVK